MKTAVSIPDALFASADACAERLGVSRSAFYAQALEAFLAHQRAGAITRRLNAVYAKDPSMSAVDPSLQSAQFGVLASGDEW